MAKKLPTKIFYISPKGLLAYEDNSPYDYAGEFEVIFRSYHLKDVDFGKIESISGIFPTLKDRKMWEAVLQDIEKSVTLGIKNMPSDIESITWSKDNKTDKDVMKIKCKDSSTYSLVAELAHQYIEIRGLINKT